MSLITNGLQLDSINQLGGIKGLWILGAGSPTGTANILTYGPYTTPPTSSGSTLVGGLNANSYLGATGISAIGCTWSGSTGTWFYFACPRDTTDYTETTTVNQENGTIFYAGALTAQFQHIDIIKEQTLQTLSTNRYLKMIYLDSNGNYYGVGFDRGGFVKDIKKTTGKKPGDAVTYSVTFNTEEINPAYPLIVPTGATGLQNIITLATVQTCTNW